MAVHPRHSRPPRPAPLSLALLMLGAAATTAFAADRADVRTARGSSCEALAGRTIGGASIASATTVAATDSLVEYCNVDGLIAPALHFELRLPTTWNHKLHYGGGGGYDGSIPPVVPAALNAGYAQVSSDSGHQASAVDASFALNDPQAAVLFGSLSVSTTMGAALEIVKARYGSKPLRSYFEGCSNGGREALIQVQRFPTLFDGVIARAPAHNWVGFMGQFNRTAKALAAPGGAFTTAKVATLAAAVRNACDALDGLVDGVVSNLQACHFDPSVLRCAGGADTGDSCLSDAQLAVVSSWTGPASYVNNTYHNTGWPLSGNEDDPGAWAPWVTVPPSLQFLFQDTTVKNYLARDPNADSLSYVYDSDPGALFSMATLNDATNADITPFVGAGGKLILWHGGSDSALSNTETAAYYGEVVNALGGRANADGSVRFYIAPGVDHCGGGVGADQTDLLTPLDKWVTRGRGPDTLTATKVDPTTGATLLSRPLCVYPEYPRYKGRGDPNSASSFRCTAP